MSPFKRVTREPVALSFRESKTLGCDGTDRTFKFGAVQPVEESLPEMKSLALGPLFSGAAAYMRGIDEIPDLLLFTVPFGQMLLI